jgi:2,5-diketo-D-gluconate reductase A
MGFGTWRISDREAEGAVRAAIDTGYRLIDTAAAYGNEGGVGRAVAHASVPREEIFVTTKLWNDRHGDADRALDESLAALGLPWVDLYLIHWPAPSQGSYVNAWKALVRLQQEGKARSIGVSNFQRHHLQEILDATGVVPAVNQIEVHPLLQQEELRRFHRDHGIVTEAWSPLAKGALFEIPALREIAAKHGKTVAQVVLRWHLQSELVAIPKSVHPDRVRENFSILDFALDDEDLRRISALDENTRVGPHPDVFT